MKADPRLREGVDRQAGRKAVDAAWPRGTECWWAQYTGYLLTAVVRVRILGTVSWAPGIYVKLAEGGRTCLVPVACLVPLDALDCGQPLNLERT